MDDPQWDAAGGAIVSAGAIIYDDSTDAGPEMTTRMSSLPILTPTGTR